MHYFKFRNVQFLWLVAVFLSSGVYSEVAFAQAQSQTGTRAGSVAHARQDQDEQIVRLAGEIEKVMEQQRAILEEIDQIKKILK